MVVDKKWKHLYKVENSTRIAELRHDGKSNKGTLRIVFLKGGTYDYQNVPFTIFLQMTQSKSVGRAFEELIKNVYQYKKVE